MERLKKLSRNPKESVENPGGLVDVISLCQGHNVKVVVRAVECLESCFSHCLSVTAGPASKIYLRPDDIHDESSLTDAEKAASSLRRHYTAGLDALQKLIIHEKEDVQQAALGALCRLVKSETVARSRPKKRAKNQGNARQYQFAVFALRRVLVSLLDTAVNCSELIGDMSEFLELDDFRFSLMKTMEMIVRDKVENKSATQCFVGNCFALLKSIVMPKMDSQIESFIVPMDAGAAEPPRKKSKKPEVSEEKQRREFYGDPASLAAHRRVFSAAWRAFLQLPLPNSILVRVLNNLHTNVMPNMINPKLLIDFLTDAYDAGGAVSLLALNGLFLLINKYNLDYPDFYEKLYALMQPSIFHQKYSSRFFRLANLFLSSSHLPAYLVAAFAKRLSRLSLTAPPAGCLVAVAMITNLLKRHPSCKVLIHRKVDSRLLDDSGEYLPPPEATTAGDPYINTEADLSKCCALDSCLWELQCLRNHFVPDVSQSLSLLDSVNDVVEIDLEQYLDISYESLQEGFESTDACLTVAIAEEPRISQPIVVI